MKINITDILKHIDLKDLLKTADPIMDNMKETISEQSKKMKDHFEKNKSQSFNESLDILGDLVNELLNKQKPVKPEPEVKSKPEPEVKSESEWNNYYDQLMRNMFNDEQKYDESLIEKIGEEIKEEEEEEITDCFVITPVENGIYTIDVLIPGYTKEEISVSINKTKNILVIYAQNEKWGANNYQIDLHENSNLIESVLTCGVLEFKFKIDNGIVKVQL